MRTLTAPKTVLDEASKLTFRQTMLVITFRVSIILTLLVIVLIGVWALLALTGGMIAAGDPLALIRGWFNAVTGL
ncbi:MAG: hypothetical protein C0619_07890 [Desulfuromonas sp.]|jgi:hypothetical protein|nr:MAG: hypothetical protein C0619_07890 [Desulfuromonas sp.]